MLQCHDGEPHEFRTSTFTGERYCNGCHRSPTTVELDDIKRRLDALESRTNPQANNTTEETQ